MNFAQLTKSASPDEALVGDLGSRPENESISRVQIKSGLGDPELFKKRCIEKLAGMEVLDFQVVVTGTGLIFEARVKSQVGIPGSQTASPNKLANQITSFFTGVKFIGVKDGKIEFVKMVKNRIRHFKGELDPKLDEADQVGQIWEEAHVMFSAMEKFDIA